MTKSELKKEVAEMRESVLEEQADQAIDGVIYVDSCFKRTGNGSGVYSTLYTPLQNSFEGGEYDMLNSTSLDKLGIEEITLDEVAKAAGFRSYRVDHFNNGQVTFLE